MLGDILENPPEFIDPPADIPLRTIRQATEAGIAHHALAADMHLLPSTVVGKKLQMETLISILFWGVNIVGYPSGFLLEAVGEKRIDA